MVQITISRGGQFKSSEANIIQSFVIDNHAFIGIFNQLMYWQGGVVWFNNGIWHFWWWYNGESFHNSIWIFFSYFGDQKSSHTWSGSSSKRVGDLESLKTITSFSFLSDDIKNWINELSTFSIVTLGPIVTSSGLTENEVIRSEKLTERSSSDGVHCSWFEIH